MRELEDNIETVQTNLNRGDSSGESAATEDRAEDSQAAKSASVTGYADRTASLDSDDDAEEVYRILEDWLAEHGPESETARTILLDAARILQTRGPLKANELRAALHKEHSDAYSSPQTLWSATISRWHEEIPGFEKVSYGTYGFNLDDISIIADSE